LLALALALALGMWLFAHSVLLPAQRARYAAMGQPMDVGDLYPRWYGARELLLHHRDPYSLQISREIQLAYYGRPLDTAGADRGRDEQRFAYPVYVVFFLAPTIELPFSATQTLARWTLALLAAGSVLLWLQVLNCKVLNWRPSAPITATLIVLTISSPPMVQALRLQQLAVLVAFLLAGCAALLFRGRLFWAGCLLACATIKPQLALLPVLWLLIWVAGNWRQRRGFVFGFAAALAFLIAAGEALLPGWLSEFVQGLIAYRHYVKVSSLLDLYLTARIAMPVTIVLLAVLLTLCFQWRKSPANHPVFFFRFAWMLAVMVVALPILPPFNQIFLLPGILAVLSTWNALRERGLFVTVACSMAAALLLSSWLVAGTLAAIHAIAPAIALGRAWTWPSLLTFAVPPVIAALLLVTLQDFPGTRKSQAAALSG